MEQEDFQTLDQSLRKFSNALYEMQNIYEDSQKPNYTVDVQAYKEPQKNAQEAIVSLMQAGDQIAETTDEFVAEDGTTVNLPRENLDRDIDNMPILP